MSEARSPVYRVGQFEIDVAAGCVRSGAEELHLRDQSFQILLHLLEHPNQLVTKDDLMDLVWEDVAVTPDALVQCIVEIRKLLRDDPHDPQFIKTTPRKGYRWIAPVSEISTQPLAALETEETTSVEMVIEEEIVDVPGTFPDERIALPPPRPWWRPRRSVGVGAMLMVVIVIAALAIWQGFRNPHATDPLSKGPPPPLAGKQPVVVMYFENLSQEPTLDWLQAGLADMVITTLSGTPGLSVLSRQQLEVYLARSGDHSKHTGLPAGLRLAQQSQAAAVVVGGFVRIGESIRVDAQLHDAGTGRLLAGEHFVAERPEQVLRQVDLMARKLAQHLGVPTVDDGARARLTTAKTDNLEAYRYYSQALDAANAMHNPEAIALLERAIALDPEFAMAHARIGYVYALTWNFGEKARPHLERAYGLMERLTEKDRLHITAWYAVAHFDFAGAIETYREIVAAYPFEIEAYRRLARLLYAEGHGLEVIDLLQQALIIDPLAKAVYNTLGGIYSDLGRHDEAISAHQRYVELDPDEANAYDSLGSSYQWAGRYEEAEEQYLRALELDPEFEIAAAHLANVYYQKGQYRETIEQLRMYERLSPTFAERTRALHRIAYVLCRRGLVEQAWAEVESGLEDSGGVIWPPLLVLLDPEGMAATKDVEKVLLSENHSERGTRPNLSHSYWALGRLALRAGDGTGAIAWFRELLSRRSLDWDLDPLQDCLANAYLELGRFDEAIAEYRRVLQLNPRYPLAHYHLGLALAGKGDVQASRAALAKFLQVWSEADDDLPQVVDAKRRLG
jgi:tetratricopeptide (TPR) repeat protein/DNA-binding winged helix-turn-helix (wHTH) protein